MACALCYAGLVGIVSVAYYLYAKYVKSQPLPPIDEPWWGKGEPFEEDEAIKEFKINVSDQVIEDLHHRLTNHVPFEPPLTKDQKYGINTNLLKTVVDHWRDEYLPGWRDREQFLNQYPQYETSIQGLKVHFLRIKPENADGLEIVPILLVNGWTSSFREYYEVIPKLTNPQQGNNFVLDLVIPSIPGFAFSEGPAKPNLNTAHIATIFKNLMKRLNIDRYYIHGTDWGAAVTQDMATMFPQQVLGFHNAMPVVATPLGKLKLLVGSVLPSLMGISKWEYKRIYPLSKTNQRFYRETGYFHLHVTKPDTVGVALRDSPVGTAAYLLEKFITLTNLEWANMEDGGLTRKYSLTQLLDNIMIYWVSRCMTTSIRIYAFGFGQYERKINLERVPVIVPTGLARFANEMFYPLPKAAHEGKYANLVHVSDLPDGGHYPALEVPELFARDLLKFVDTVRKLRVC
ncbi:juvenile hormone epoxide hydrolase 1-like [Cylas formicarius]|uniref:juvenile hormone epoxide hydrolase 1-like n=1 Tax=Cylas formicarius TaxID=197179 RepID=UPI002958A198|nr:juvenile hormone epoxide hydrolase 1-like [Cylas formicarius]